MIGCPLILGLESTFELDTRVSYYYTDLIKTRFLYVRVIH